MKEEKRHLPSAPPRPTPSRHGGGGGRGAFAFCFLRTHSPINPGNRCRRLGARQEERLLIHQQSLSCSGRHASGPGSG